MSYQTPPTAERIAEIRYLAQHGSNAVADFIRDRPDSAIAHRLELLAGYDALALEHDWLLAKLTAAAPAVRISYEEHCRQLLAASAPGDDGISAATDWARALQAELGRRTAERDLLRRQVARLAQNDFYGAGRDDAIEEACHAWGIRTHTDPAPAENASCVICRCTEDEPCDGGCA